MLDTIITNKTRIKLLLKFFVNQENKSYLRKLASEFGDSTNAIRIELNRLEAAGVLTSEADGNRKMFKANRKYPLYDEMYSIVRKFVGIDKIIDEVARKIGDLHSAYLTGELARGINSSVIELTLVGNQLDEAYIDQLVQKAEAIVNRNIQTTILQLEEIEAYLKNNVALIIWKAQKENNES